MAAKGNNNRLGQYLRTLREKAGLSTYQVAQRIERSGSFVSRIERGERGVDLYDLWRMTTVLGGDYPTAVRAAIADAGVPDQALR